MTVFRPDTSFPYLALSRSSGIDYATVLQVSDMLWRRYMRWFDVPDMWSLSAFTGLEYGQINDIYAATKAEHERRRVV